MNQKNRIALIVGVVVVVALAVLGVALLVTGDDSEESESVAATTPGDEPAPDDTAAAEGAEGDEGDDAATEPPTDGLEVYPVTVTGDPLAPYDETIADPTVGTAAPVVDGQDYDGNPQSIGGPADGPTLLVFLAHWCPHCNDEIPELIALQEAGELPEDLNVVGVSTAVRDDADNYPPSVWLEERGWPWPVLADSIDSEAIIAYGGTAFPFTTLLDADGNVIARKTGAASADDIKAWLDSSLA